MDAIRNTLDYCEVHKNSPMKTCMDFSKLTSGVRMSAWRIVLEANRNTYTHSQQSLRGTLSRGVITDAETILWKPLRCEVEWGHSYVRSTRAYATLVWALTIFSCAQLDNWGSDFSLALCTNEEKVSCQCFASPDQYAPLAI